MNIQTVLYDTVVDSQGHVMLTGNSDGRCRAGHGYRPEGFYTCYGSLNIGN